MVCEGLVSVDMLERIWCFCFDLIHQNFQIFGNILRFSSPFRIISKMSVRYLKFDVGSATEVTSFLSQLCFFLVYNPKLTMGVV